MWSLEDTLIGFLIDRLVFCVDSQSFDYKNQNCKEKIEYTSFWNAASKWFAEKSRGTAYVMLNGDYKTAVYNKSTFYKIELPNMRNVQKLITLLVSTPGNVKYETCASGKSLEDMKEYLMTKKIEYECIDNSKEILFYMCFKNPLAKECQNVVSLSNNSSIIISMTLIGNMILAFLHRFS